MFGELQLDKMEEKQIKEDVKELTMQRKISIKYLQSSALTIGEDTTDNWSNYSDYWCSIQEVTNYNIKRYDFGNIEVGDIILNLPYDTELPKDAQEYKIDYEDKIYTAKSDLTKQKFHYVMVGGL